MKEKTAAAAEPYARTTGAVYLLYFLTAVAGQILVKKGFGAAGKATQFASDLLYLALAILFYRLFRPVSRALSLAAAIVSMAGCAMTIVAMLRGTVPVNPLVFFGMYCLLIGWLIVQSDFLPAALGWLMMLAGVGWYCFLTLHAHSVAIATEAIGFLAELALMLWLLVRGVNRKRPVQAALT